MDINSATNYNYTCLSDEGVNQTRECSLLSISFLRVVLGMHWMGRDRLVMIPLAGTLPQLGSQVRGVSLWKTDVSWNSKPVFRKAVKGNKRPNTNRTLTARLWFSEFTRMPCVCSTSCTRYQFPKKVLQMIWINWLSSLTYKKPYLSGSILNTILDSIPFPLDMENVHCEILASAFSHNLNYLYSFKEVI